VLVHGFGASAFHWRFNVPALSEDRPVYALDLVGFGASDKPLVEYSAELWRDQVGAFLKEVVQAPAIVAGNSIGGYTALHVAATFPERTAGCVLLNAAGKFSAMGVETAVAADAAATTATTTVSLSSQTAVDEVAPSSTAQPAPFAPMETVKKLLGKGVVYAGFFVTKQPARISQVLKQVYPVDPSNVDAELVESIRFPADSSPNCAEVFYRVVSRNTAEPDPTKPPTPCLDELLPSLTAAKTPLWLVWGQADPWIRPQVADKIVQLKPGTVRVNVAAGHCPHDEAPIPVNAALRDVGVFVDAAASAA